MKLIYLATQHEVRVGDQTKTFRGVPCTVKSFHQPHKPASSGFVLLEWADGSQSEMYVGVIGAEWIDREDRQENVSSHISLRMVDQLSKCDNNHQVSHLIEGWVN